MHKGREESLSRFAAAITATPVDVIRDEIGYSIARTASNRRCSITRFTPVAHRVLGVHTSVITTQCSSLKELSRGRATVGVGRGGLQLIGRRGESIRTPTAFFPQGLYSVV